MNSEDNPRNMTQEENSHNTAKYESKVCFSSAGFTRSHVRVPANKKFLVKVIYAWIMHILLMMFN